MRHTHLYSFLPRKIKKLFLVLADIVFLLIALWSSFALRFSDWWPDSRMLPFWWMFTFIPAVGVVIFMQLGLYRSVVRFMGNQAVLAVVKGVALLSLVLYAIAHLSGASGFPRSIPINFALISAFYVAGSRYLVKAYYQHHVNTFGGKEAILIYGAGEAGTKLHYSLLGSKEFNPVAFVDDDATLHGEIVNGLSVYAAEDVPELIRRFFVTRVVLAVPAASAVRRKQIIDKLKPLSIRVQTLPTLAELASGTSSFNQFHEVGIDELLGRESVEPDEILLSQSVTGKVVLVTGAGGSIGSELCRQISFLKPRSLVMLDNNEFALYSIDRELSEKMVSKLSGQCHVVSVLGSVLEPSLMQRVIKEHAVDILFHAAAYKHVPMVEHNMLEGIRNNILGTQIVATVALEYGIERFILISTDKAVRPSSVMGATKRVAEQVVQACSRENSKTVFSMVRFGNVLGSSGSVVPLFRQQIEQGGPVTVTHKDVTRYFMSIPEAAQLVIQAASMAKGGDLYVLDMGAPVRIADLARNMIELSGHSVKDAVNPRGDIAIEYIGLRASEKLHEELLLENNAEDTSHVRIKRVNERGLDADKIAEGILKLKNAIECNDTRGAEAILLSLVPEYRPNQGLA